MQIPTPPPSPLPDPYPTLREAEPPEMAEQLLTDRENVREWLGEPQPSDRREGELMFELPPEARSYGGDEFYPGRAGPMGPAGPIRPTPEELEELLDQLNPRPIFDPSRGWNRIEI